MILELLWELIYGSRKVNLKVYRVTENREGLVFCSLVYENIEQGRFVQKTSFGIQQPIEAVIFNDLSDTWNALNGLKDVSFFMDSNTWQRLAAESIDAAVDKANVQVEELRQMRKRLSAVSTKKRRGKLRARASINEGVSRLAPGAEGVTDASRIGGRAPRRGIPTWKPVESTQAGANAKYS